MLPTAIAPTIELATPRVKKFAEKLAAKSNAEIVEFYEAVPCHHVCSTADGQRYAMGSWGLELKGFPIVATLESASIQYEASYSHCRDNTMIWLHGRTLR